MARRGGGGLWGGRGGGRGGGGGGGEGRGGTQGREGEERGGEGRKGEGTRWGGGAPQGGGAGSGGRQGGFPRLRGDLLPKARRSPVPPPRRGSRSLGPARLSAPRSSLVSACPQPGGSGAGLAPQLHVPGLPSPKTSLTVGPRAARPRGAFLPYPLVDQPGPLRQSLPPTRPPKKSPFCLRTRR